MDRSDINLIFPTLTFNLACKFSKFKHIITKVIDNNPKVGYESLTHQLKDILLDPLSNFQPYPDLDPLNTHTRSGGTGIVTGSPNLPRGLPLPVPVAGNPRVCTYNRVKYNSK